MASRYALLHNDIVPPLDAQQQLLQDWVLWQRGRRGMSDKTITDRLTILRRIPDAASITPQGVDRFLTSAAWAKATRASYHGAIRAWCKWLIITGRRADDPTLIATTPKVKKGRPRPVADEHLAILLDTRMYKRTRAMILLAAYAGLRVSEIAAVKRYDVDAVINNHHRHRQRRQRAADTAAPHPQGPGHADAPKRLVVPHLHRQHQTPRRRTHARQLRQRIHLQRHGPRRHPRHPPRATPLVRYLPCGSALREAGVDSLVIKELMGHESLATTAIYVDVPLKQRSAAVSLLPVISSVRPALNTDDDTTLEQFALFDWATR